jgi:tRNA(fMet)-specific endonuclease VapC
MSLYILETDTLQLFQDGHPSIVAHLQAIAPDDRAISVITVEEQLSGWYAQLRQAKRPERLAWAYRRLADTVRFLSRIQIIDFDEATVQRYDDLKKNSTRSRLEVRLSLRGKMQLLCLFRWLDTELREVVDE